MRRASYQQPSAGAGERIRRAPARQGLISGGLDLVPPGPPPPPSEPAVALPAPAPFRKSGGLFFLLLLGLFLPGLVAQALHPAAGLAWSEVFVFLLPAFVVAAGSNLEPVRYLGLRRVGLPPVTLAVLVGAAGFLVANGVMALWVKLLPAWVPETFDVGRVFDAPRSEQIVLAVSASVLAPLCEEVAFRGYLQRTLAIRHGPGLAIAATALLFAILHLDPVRFPALVLLGAAFGWLSWRAGSVWPSIVAHATNNGIASGVVLSQGIPSGDAPLPPTADLLRALAVGGAAFGLLAAGYRAATPSPPPATDAIALRDPADPSTRFRAARVPLALWMAAALGLTLLGALGLHASLHPGAPREPPPPVLVPGR